MSEYVTVHKIGDREILVDIRKKRVYAKPRGFITKDLFRYGQSALDAVFAILAVVEPKQIDYILDMRYCEALPEEVLSLWKEKALEFASKYPQAHTVGVADADSPFWLQISQWKEIFEAYGDRILGVFQTREKAEAFLDELRGFSRVTS